MILALMPEHIEVDGKLIAMVIIPESSREIFETIVETF
jgi:hypothetical protein